MNSAAFSIHKKKLYRIFVITMLILSIPLIAMQLTHEVSWKIGDFIVAGGLLFGFGCLYEFMILLMPGRKNRIMITIVLLFLLLLTWSLIAVDLI